MLNAFLRFGKLNWPLRRRSKGDVEEENLHASNESQKSRNTKRNRIPHQLIVAWTLNTTLVMSDARHILIVADCRTSDTDSETNNQRDDQSNGHRLQQAHVVAIGGRKVMPENHKLPEIIVPNTEGGFRFGAGLADGVAHRDERLLDEEDDQMDALFESRSWWWRVHLEGECTMGIGENHE